MQAVPVDNPPNPWASHDVEYLSDEPPPEIRLRLFRDASRTILSRNDSPDLGFEWSVNPYRGCFHACAYCYARPTHEYLGFGAGTDFDRNLVVKFTAPELLRQELVRRRRRLAGAVATGGGPLGSPLTFSGVTDCYQPIEASYRLTRACLEVCAEFAQPVGIITKAPLVERDLDVLEELARVATVRVAISVPFADAEVARALEPYASSPERRLRTIERLAARGLDVAINVAPVIPGLNDSDVPELLRAAHAAGARSAGCTLLRLPGNVKSVFEARLRAAFPQRADRVLSLLRSAHGGALYDGRFGHRGRGAGPIADNIHALFRATALRLGLAHACWANERITTPTVADTAAAAGATGAPAPSRHPAQLRLF